MARRPRRTALLALLAAAAILGGAAWLLLGEEEGSLPGETRGDPPGATLAAVPGERTGATGEGGAGPAPSSASDGGLVTGVLVLPRADGRPPVEARLSVLREGATVAEATSAGGAFSLPYGRAAGDRGPFRLRAAAAGRSPVEVDLPAPATAAGEIRLYEGIVYGGRAVDDRGLPRAGITFHLLVDGVEAAASEPSSPDGGFRIPVPPGTRLQGFFLAEEPAWGSPPTLEPRAPGRLFVPAPAAAEGLTGVHRVVVEERPVGIRLRLLDGSDGTPLAGADVSLFGSPDVFALGPPSPADRGAADAEGIWAPRWPLALKWAGIRVVLPGGRIAWTVLDRAYAEGAEPRDLVLPAETPRLRVRCSRGEGPETVAGAFVVLPSNAGFAFWGTSGGDGSFAFDLFESDSFDPVPFSVNGWTAAWEDGERGWRLEAGGAAAGADFAWDVESPTPLAVRLGEGEANGIWIATGGSGPWTAGRPSMLTCNLRGKDPAKDGWALLFSAFKGPVRGPGGATLWWSYDFAQATLSTATGPFGGRPPETPLDLELTTRDGPGVRIEASLAQVAAARGSLHPLVFEEPPLEGMTRTLRVLDGTGRPRPGALVSVLRDDRGDFWPARETERLAADGQGRAVLQTLDPAGRCRVLAWDPADGACGILDGPREDAPESAWTVRVDPPRTFRIRLRMADGSLPSLAYASLVPLSGMLPPVQVSFRDGPEGTAPEAALLGYEVQVYARDAKGRTVLWKGAAAAVSGTEVVLGEATGASGR